MNDAFWFSFCASTDFTTRFEALQNAANTAAAHVNARGDTVTERVENIFSRVQDVVLHGVHHGAAAAFTAAQVHTGQSMQGLNHMMLEDDDAIEAVIDNFEPVAAMIASDTMPMDVINRVFH